MFSPISCLHATSLKKNQQGGLKLFAAGHNWTLRYTLECCKKKLLNELIINRTFCDPHIMLFSSHRFELIRSFVHPTTAVNKITYAHDAQHCSNSRASFLYVHVIEAVSERGHFDRA